MINLQSISKQNDLVYSQKRRLAYGQYKGYPAVIQCQQKNGLCRAQFSVKTENGQDAALSTFLSGLKNQHKLLKFASYEKNILSVGVVNKGLGHKNSDRQFSEILDAVAGYCAGNQLAPCCAVCGEQQELGIYSVFGNYQILCPACFEKAKAELADAQQQLHEKHTNYAAGIVGAFLGSLPGLALWLIFAQMGKIAAITAFALVVGSLYGYKKLGGKLNVVGILVSLAISAAILYVSDYTDIAIQIFNAYHSEYDISFFDSFRLVPKALQDSEINSAFLYNLGMGYVMFAIAAAFSSFSIFKNANLKYEMKKIG